MVKLFNGTEENIRVIVRIKPNVGEKYETIVSSDKENNSIILSERDPYIFDKVAPGNTTQDEMFESCKNLFQSFIDGYNATIFAYGQTGSGKTFTMTGESSGGIDSSDCHGLIPRGLSYIFDKVNERSLTNNVDYLIKCTFVEIYNEQIYDLLDTQLQRLNIRINVSNEAYLEQCTELIMENPKMAKEILKRGLLNRHMASTEMNRESSRSHAVFTVVLESRMIQGDVASIKKSCLHLVDLAGSERQRDSKTEGIRLKEAGMINKSLLALSMVIRKLADPSKGSKTPFIAYRDSKLTLLLKDAIGGNSKTSLVACVHNDIRFLAETLSTLQFASSVKMIKNSAKINVNIQGDNEALRKEISRLRELLAHSKVPQPIQPEEFDCDLVWKKRFVTAMSLRSSLNLDLSTLHEQITTSNTIKLELEKTIDMLKMEIELKDKKLEKLENKLLNKNVINDVVDNQITKVLEQLKEQRLELSERIKSDQLQIQVKYYSNELIKSNNLNSLSASDQTLIYSLMNDFNSIIANGAKNVLTEFDGKDAQIAQLTQEVSQLKNKHSALMNTMKSINIARREERRQLEENISSLRCRLKVIDEQRETAVFDRRNTILTATQGCSPIRNIREQNHIYDLCEDGEFLSGEEFFKKNDSLLLQMDKITSLENELLVNKTKIGSMEYSLVEYKKEIEELQRSLHSKAKLEANLDAMKEIYNATHMSLLDANETINKVEKEKISLEVMKEKTVKLFTEKIFSLEEELKNSEADKEMYRDESERSKMSLVCLKAENKRLEANVTMIQKENSQKNSIIESLNSKIDDNISVFEEIASANEKLTVTKRELEEAIASVEDLTMKKDQLERRVDELLVSDHRMKADISLLEDEIAVLQLDNNNLSDANEELQSIELELQIEMTEMTNEYKNKIYDMDTRCKEMEYETNYVVDEKEEIIVKLRDEVESLKTQLEDFEKENCVLKEKSVSGNQCSGIPFQLRSPLNNSSPLVKKNIDGRRSLLDDLMMSRDRPDQALREEHENTDMINGLMESIFASLTLPLSKSIYQNLVTIQSRLKDYQIDLEDLVIKKLIIEERLKNKSSICDQVLMMLRGTQEQRDSYKTLLQGLIGDMSSVDQSEITNKVKYFRLLKEKNSELRNENMNLIEEKYRVRKWLHENNYLRLFESVDCGDSGHYLSEAR